MLIVLYASGWRSATRTRNVRLGLDYYCATTVYYLRAWAPGYDNCRSWAQQQLAVVESLLIDSRHAARYAATRGAREALTSIHHATAKRIAEREVDWLKEDSKLCCELLADAVGEVLTHRSFRQWTTFSTRLDLVAESATPNEATNKQSGISAPGEVVAVAGATLLLAALSRLGLTIDPP